MNLVNYYFKFPEENKPLVLKKSSSLDRYATFNTETTYSFEKEGDIFKDDIKIVSLELGGLKKTIIKDIVNFYCTIKYEDWEKDEIKPTIKLLPFSLIRTLVSGFGDIEIPEQKINAELKSEKTFIQNGTTGEHVVSKGEICIPSIETTALIKDLESYWEIKDQLKSIYFNFSDFKNKILDFIFEGKTKPEFSDGKCSAAGIGKVRLLLSFLVTIQNEEDNLF